MASAEFTQDKNCIAEISGLLDAFQLSENYKRFGYSANSVISGVIDASEVVVKPFRGFAREGAGHEALMLDMVNGLEIPTLKPLSLHVAKIANYLITRYEPEIKLLNNPKVEYWHPAKLEETAGKIGKMLSKLHSGGIVHGDCQLKNLFVNKDEEIGVMDLENSEFCINTWDSEFFGDCSYDLETIVSSTTHVLGQEQGSMANQVMINSYHQS